MNDDNTLLTLSQAQAQALSNKLMYFYNCITGDKLEAGYFFMGALIERISNLASKESGTAPSQPSQPSQPVSPVQSDNGQAAEGQQ